MAINKVDYGSKTLIDLTSDTVSPDTLIAGVAAHAANGERITGTFDPSIYMQKACENLTASNDLNVIRGFRHFKWGNSVPKNAPKSLKNCTGISYGDPTVQLVSTATGDLYYRVNFGKWRMAAFWEV